MIRKQPTYQLERNYASLSNVVLLKFLKNGYVRMNIFQCTMLKL